MLSGTPVKQEDGVKKEEPASGAATPAEPTTFRDIPLYSSSTGDWKHHLMKLASHARVNPSDAAQFPGPVRLNRKLPPKEKDKLPKAGSPVLDQYGNAIMVPPPSQDGNPAPTGVPVKKIPLLWPFPDDDSETVEAALARLNPVKGATADASLIGPSATANNATRQKAGMFQKRVREVYKASSVARKTMNEEALPWVLEDWETKKKWEPAKTPNRNGLKALEQAIKVRKEGGAWPVRLSSKAKPEEDGVKKEEVGVRGKKGKGKGDESSEEDDDDPHGPNHSPWIGKLDGEAHESASTSAGGAMSHALFIFDDRGAGGFRMVPVSRMYKFLQRPKHANKIGWEEAEELYKKQQKARMGEGVLDRFIHRQNGDDGNPAIGRRVGGASSWSGRGGAGAPKKEDDDIAYLRELALPGSFSARNSNAYDRDSSSRRSKFTAVSSGPRVKSEEGTYGEIDFEESFPDDEERNEGDDYALGEEETKELEQRLKREMAKAEEDAAREEADEDDDLFDDGRGRKGRREDDQLTGSGKQMRKIMRALGRREGNEAYDEDDEDRDPYASEDSDDEDTVMNNPEEALRQVREEKEREAREAAKNGAQTNGSATADASKRPSNENSRANTPSGRSEKHAQQSNVAGRGQPQQQAGRRPQQQQQQQGRPGAGHASVAQRATSPNRAGSHSRQGSRSGSPDRATPPPSLKRKSDTANSGNSTPSSHNRLDSNDSSKRPRTSSNLQRGGSQSRSNSQPGSPRSEEAPGARSPSGAGTRSPPAHAGSRSGSPSRREGGQRVPASPLEQEILDLVKSGAVKDTKELIRHFFKAGRLNPPNFKTQLTSAVTAVLIKGEDSSLNPKPGY